MQQSTKLLLTLLFLVTGQSGLLADTIFLNHRLVLDNQHKIMPWYTPQEKAYDHLLRARWDFIKTKVPNSPGPEPRSCYPQYYFYDGFFVKDGAIVPDYWMNDIGEKIPNWFENARLYYAYTGDSSVMKIVKDLIDYTLEHGTSPSAFPWPNFPYTTTNHGDMEFRGLTPQFALHETHLDHAAEMGFTYYRMYLFYGDNKYLTAALNVADLLAANVRTGNAEKSALPYRVNMETGKITAEYGANWTGAYMLFDNLLKADLGDAPAYKVARDKIRDFLLNYPLKTGYWTDGHSDNPVNSNTYKSNLSASNFKLVLFDYPELDPNWKTDIPELIQWTEDNFVFRCAPKDVPPSTRDIVDLKKTPGVPSEPARLWGAHIVGEQDGFIFKMDYQTARYGAECARWYSISGDEAYKEKAYRSLNLVTYCNDSSGMVFESPFSNGISNWWSDCYGESPRMFYHAFAGIPELAPPRENHILYSEGILNGVDYQEDRIRYFAKTGNGTEYLRLAFIPLSVTLDGRKLKYSRELNADTYTLKELGNGDYSMVIQRRGAGEVVISGREISLCFDGAIRSRPEPENWYAGDIHVHRNCGEVTSILAETEFTTMMEPNDLAVISVLADMGNGEVKDSNTDLPKVNGKDAPYSKPGRLVHWDAEWHFDPAGVTFEKKALGGHLVFLGLKEAHTLWDESPAGILAWAKKQGAVKGFCHMQYLNDSVQHELTCCIPMDYPVEAALGTIDFLSEDVWLNDASINAYYKILNCGFRMGWTAGTDFPCNNSEPLGSLLTYVEVKDRPLTYQGWIEGIRKGRTVVTTNGHAEFLELKVNGTATPGDEIRCKGKNTFTIEATWTAVKEQSGRIEIVCNGRVVANLPGTAEPGKPVFLQCCLPIDESSWICARRMDDAGHRSHTAPVYITIDKRPVRASIADALFFIKWIDNLLEKTSPGGAWNQYFTHDLDVVQGRYRKARAIYERIAAEARLKTL